MSQKNKIIQDYYKILKLNFPMAIIWIIAISMLPLYTIFSAKELLPFVALLYQVLGILLLYIDENYKMKRRLNVYPKSNTFYWRILRSPQNVISALRNIYKLLINPPTKECKLELELKMTQINHDYHNIENPIEKEEQRVNSIESDLSQLRYFSELRKAGYILMSIGFFIQFLALTFS